MKKPQFKGYILEHILAYVLQSSGYSVILKVPAGDPDITNKKNGLNIIGRGAKHQIDVIGDLDWIPAFTFPVRLIVEAKFRDAKTGIDIVREQIGILSDINENYFSVNSDEPKPRYRYVSVVFSASGFSGNAIDLGIAHQIQLVDMSGDLFSVILLAINEFTDAVFGNRESIESSESKIVRENLVKTLFNRERDFHEIANSVSINSLKEKIDTFKSHVFVGMSQSGFMLLLHDKNNTFLEYARHHKAHDIVIHWETADGGKIWEMGPVDDASKYKLRFKLPERLHNWIYKSSENMFKTAIDEKQKHFSKISIYHKKENGEPEIFTLRFDKNNLK